MKKQITTTALALLFVLGLQFTFSNSAAAQQLTGKTAHTAEQSFNMDIAFSGMKEAQPLFSLQFSNQGLKKPYMIITDGNREVLYTENLKQETAKKSYRLDTPGYNDTVTFELYDEGKKLYSKTFRISQVTEIQTRVSETK